MVIAMKMNLIPFFQDIENRIQPEEEERLTGEWIRFAEGKSDGVLFMPQRKISKSSVVWPAVRINEAYEDTDLMIYRELKQVSDLMESGSGLLLSMRANYGTGIIPSMFGCEIFRLPDDADTLPGTRPLANPAEAVRAIAESPLPDFSKGLAPRVFSFGCRLKELLSRFPKMSRYVNVYNPDLQGPFPVCDMLWGSEIYFEFYEDDTVLFQLEEIVTETIAAFLTKWQELFPPVRGGYSVEWGLLHRGKMILRNDAVVNISPEQYRRFVKTYDQKLMARFGGGIHFCGKCDHVIADFASLANLSCINLSQPELNDMEKIYSSTVDRGISLIGMSPAECRRVCETRRELHHRLHCGASLSMWKRGGRE